MARKTKTEYLLAVRVPITVYDNFVFKFPSALKRAEAIVDLRRKHPTVEYATSKTFTRMNPRRKRRNNKE